MWVDFENATTVEHSYGEAIEMAHHHETVQILEEMKATRKEVLMMKMEIMEVLKLLGFRIFVEWLVVGFFWEFPRIYWQALYGNVMYVLGDA